MVIAKNYVLYFSLRIQATSSLMSPNCMLDRKPQSSTLDQTTSTSRHDQRAWSIVFGHVSAKESMPWPSGPWRRKVESPSRLRLGTILGLLGQSLTYMGPRTRLWIRSLGTAWKGVRHPRQPDLWASLCYVLLGHI